MSEIKRKYRGALRIAPFRAALAEARLHPEDQDALKEATLRLWEEAQKAGVHAVATDARNGHDKLFNLTRCKECDRVGNRGAFVMNGCKSCLVRENEKRLQYLVSIGRAPRARRVQQPQHRRLTFVDKPLRNTEGDFPWRWTSVKKRGRYVLQRAWGHLRGQLPDFNQMAQWTEEERIRHRVTIANERARRRAKANSGD